MKSSETPSPRATLKAAMSLIPSLKTVLIQTQIFVATMCIRPNRAKHLNWWMLSWKRKMFYLSFSSIWRKSNDLWGKVATLWIVPGQIIVIRVRNWGCCRKIHSPLSSWRQNTFEKMWRLFAGQGWRLWWLGSKENPKEFQTKIQTLIQRKPWFQARMLKANVVKMLNKILSLFTKSANSEEETSVTLFILWCFVLLQFNLAVVVTVVKSSIIQSPHSHSTLQWDKLWKFCQFMNCLVNFLYPSLTEISFPTARHFTLTFSIFPLRTKFYWESQITLKFLFLLYMFD